MDILEWFVALLKKDREDYPVNPKQKENIESRIRTSLIDTDNSNGKEDT